MFQTSGLAPVSQETDSPNTTTFRCNRLKTPAEWLIGREKGGNPQRLPP